MLNLAVFFTLCVAGALSVGSKIPMTNEDIQQLHFQRILDTVEDDYWGVRHFISGTKQLVAGILYEFDVAMQPKSASMVIQQCHFKVLYQAWRPQPMDVQILEDSCDRSVVEADMTLPGGKTEITEDDLQSPSFALAIHESIKAFNMQSNSAIHQAMSQFLMGTKQVVSGVLYEFDAEMTKTECRNIPENHDKGLDECRPLLGAGRPMVCTFKVRIVQWDPSQNSAEVSMCH